MKSRKFSPFSRRKAFIRFLARPVWLGAAFFVLSHGARAQIVTDGTLGPAGNLIGPNYQIPAALGQKVGRNLFHSFADFQLYSGESATFSGPASVKNILSRVTGGNPSLLNGQINSDIAGANFFFINPAGVVFGPEVQLNVSGSFVATTADLVKLGQNGSFNALNPSDTILTAASPTAFGFLTPAPQPILLSGARLGTSTGQTVALIGGGIGLQDGAVIGTFDSDIDLISVKSAGEVKLDVTKSAQPMDVSGFSELGRVEISGDSQASIVGQGTIEVRADSLTVDGTNSFLLQLTGDARPNNGIDIQARGDVILRNGGAVVSEALGQAKGGDIFIRANRLGLLEGGVVLANTGGKDGGTTPRDPARTGNGGDVVIRAGEIHLENQNSAVVSGVASNIEAFGVGNGGNLDVEAQNIEILGFSAFSSDNRGAGNAGLLSIKADSILLDRGTATGFNGISAQSQAQSQAGRGGDVSVTARSLFLTNGSQISASTLGSGTGGDVTIKAGTLLIDSKGKGSTSDSPTAIVTRSDAPTGGGKAGNILIIANTAKFLDGALVSSSTLGDGDGGEVVIDAKSLTLSGNESLIASNSQDPAGGKSGDITLSADQLEVSKGALISASTAGNNVGGTIFISADTLTVDGQGAARQTAIASETGGAANSGGIQIEARDVQIVNGGSLSTNTFGAGAGGTIQINADNVTLDGRGAKRFTGITAGTSVQSGGRGGDIKIQTGQLTIKDQSLISSSTLGSGQGADVIIAAKDVALDSGIIASLATNSGDAGSVTIRATGSVNLGAQSTINVASDQSNGGSVFIDANSIFLSDSEVNSLADGRLPNGTIVRDKGNGGNIELRATNRILLKKDSLLSAQARANGGNIVSLSRQIIFDRSRVLANAINGSGGNISLRSKVFLSSAESRIDASSRFGIAGNVAIESPNTNVGGSLIALPSNLLSAENYLAPRCAVRGTSAGSSLTIDPQNGVPTQPGDLLP